MSVRDNETAANTTQNITFSDQTANFLKTKEYLEHIPIFSGREDSRVTFSDFELAVRDCISWDGDKNEPLIQAILRRVAFPDRSYLDGLDVSNASDIIQRLGSVYRQWRDPYVYRCQIAKMKIHPNEKADAFNLRLQSIIKKAKATFESCCPEKSDRFIRDIEETALEKFEQQIPADLTVEVRAKKCKTLKEAFAVVSPLIRKRQTTLQLYEDIELPFKPDDLEYPYRESRRSRVYDDYDDRREYRYRDSSNGRSRDYSRGRYEDRDSPRYENRGSYRHDNREYRDRYSKKDSDSLFPIMGAMKDLHIEKGRERSSQDQPNRSENLAWCDDEDLRFIRDYFIKKYGNRGRSRERNSSIDRRHRDRSNSHDRSNSRSSEGKRERSSERKSDSLNEYGARSQRMGASQTNGRTAQVQEILRK